MYAEGFDDYDGYLDLMQRIFGEVLRITKPGGFCAVVIGTVLMKGTHVPVPFDIVARLVQAGWLFHQDIIWHKTTMYAILHGHKRYRLSCHSRILQIGLETI